MEEGGRPRLSQLPRMIAAATWRSSKKHHCCLQIPPPCPATCCLAAPCRGADLVRRILTPDVAHRAKLDEILNHPWLRSHGAARRRRRCWRD